MRMSLMPWTGSTMVVTGYVTKVDLPGGTDPGSKGGPGILDGVRDVPPERP